MHFSHLQAPGYTPEPWTPIDTLTWAKVMSWDLSGNFRDEIVRTILADTLSPEQVAQLYPPFPPDHPVIVPAGLSSTQESRTVAARDRALQALSSAARATQTIDALTGGGFEGIGSNNWVVDGSLTASGMPILANDPHLAIQMPSIWYEIGIHCNAPSDACPFDVVGFTFPGTPGVIVGHNANIAWGVTTEAADTQDLYIEKINPENPYQHEVDGAWEDMTVRTETINVAGGQPLSYEVRTTRHGPIISGLFEAADDLATTEAGSPDRLAVALAWQTLEPSTLVESILGINRARNWDEFRAAASLWDIAAQNLIYADIEGNIGYQSTGEIPVRPSANGLVPVSGWDSGNDWTGIVPFYEMPFLLNPARGFIETANQPVLPASESPRSVHCAAVKRYVWPDNPDFQIEERDREAFIVLVASTVLLLLFFYWGRPNFYFTNVIPAYGANAGAGPLSDLAEAGAYVWWGMTSMVLRVGVPLVVIVWLLRKRPSDFGFRFRGIRTHLPIYGVMYIIMLPILVWVSGFDSFLSYYPFYSRAAEGGAAFWLYELGYGLQFVGVEAFFRGFMTFGLLPRFGVLSVVVMTVPYTMIHFSKPMPEAVAAIVAGLVLGLLAVKTKSFVPGILLHISVALTMDLLILTRLGVVGNLF